MTLHLYLGLCLFQRRSDASLHFFDVEKSFLGCLFQHHEGLVGPRKGSEQLIEFALGGRLLAFLGVLDSEDHGQGDGRYRYLERGDQAVGKLRTAPATIPPMADPMTTSPTTG